LTLQKIESGSVKLLLDSSSDGFNRIKVLFENGQLKDLLGFPIQAVAQEGINSTNQQEKESDRVAVHAVHLSLHDQLEKMVLAAQSHPPSSEGRRRALSRLIYLLQKSGKLTRPQRLRQEISQELYEEIYAESKQMLFLYIWQGIDRYDPTRGTVLQWVNFKLSRFFIQASRDILSSYEDPSCNEDLELHGLTSSPSLSQMVLQLLHEDPEFRQTSLAKYPQVNFQYIAIRRISGFSWQEISTEIGAPISDLRRFYSRCLKKFSSKFMQQLL
jgi:DNA-directed RNA polymerase specialized sigma24 family protein